MDKLIGRYRARQDRRTWNERRSPNHPEKGTGTLSSPTPASQSLFSSAPFSSMEMGRPEGATAPSSRITVRDE